MWAYYLVQRYLKFLNLFKFNLKILERFFWGMNLLELKIQVSSFSEFSWKYPKITHQSFGFFAKLMCRLINILKATSYFRSYKIIFLCNLNLIVLFCLFSEFQTRNYWTRNQGIMRPIEARVVQSCSCPLKLIIDGRHKIFWLFRPRSL